ncbi:Heparan sulfate 2-O-sulfotransferase 1 [Oryzias melastigma]|uniref:Heparan sulfate 2-O-sulfotransferase 1 n=1 Tax=Oryzias melastigma TaxID=30732 RepID=A0A834CG36_ORYME|nr:Heparan sulfate 2-O-sulfotransferase 1 [Oryzias melastigma]
MGLSRITMPPKIQLLAVLAFGVAMLLIENQIQRLDESRAKLDELSLRSNREDCEEEGVISLPEPKLGWMRDTLRQQLIISSWCLSLGLVVFPACLDSVRFVQNVSAWREMKPAFYHGHVAYLDFSKYGVTRKPMYINVVRDPIERLVSYYYFLRFGDDYRPGLRRRKQGDKKVSSPPSPPITASALSANAFLCFRRLTSVCRRGGSDCAPEKLWLQIPFFCGHHAECWNVGSKWALEQAKYNLLNEFLLVGVTEELEDFVMILEAALPRFFRGATELYRTGKKSHLRKTTEKKPPTKETTAKLQQSDIWKMENDFYEFALEQFQFVRAHAVREKNGELYVLAQSFFYEKIYPKAN